MTDHLRRMDEQEERNVRRAVDQLHRDREAAVEAEPDHVVCVVCRKLIETTPRYFDGEGRPRHMLCQPIEEAEPPGWAMDEFANGLGEVDAS